MVRRAIEPACSFRPDLPPPYTPLAAVRALTMAGRRRKDRAIVPS